MLSTNSTHLLHQYDKACVQRGGLRSIKHRVEKYQLIYYHIKVTQMLNDF